MNYAVQDVRSPEAEIDWNLITIRCCLRDIAAMRHWCDEHKSDGKFFCFLVYGAAPHELWYFELEKDALLFALTWGA